MNIENLRVGNSYKNYGSLCEELGETVRSGKSRQLQLKDWNRYFSFSKMGRIYTIEAVYKTPHEKINLRSKGNNRIRESIEFTNPDLASEWIIEKNGEITDSITRTCDVNYWWKCSTCNKEIYSSPRNRLVSNTKKKIRCPYCSKKLKENIVIEFDNFDSTSSANLSSESFSLGIVIDRINKEDKMLRNIFLKKDEIINFLNVAKAFEISESEYGLIIKISSKGYIQYFLKHKKCKSLTKTSHLKIKSYSFICKSPECKQTNKKPLNPNPVMNKAVKEKTAKISNSTITNKHNFKDKVYSKYGDEFIVLGEYKKSDIPIRIKHNIEKCGKEYDRYPKHFLYGKGLCPHCRSSFSKGEQKIIKILETKAIKYEKEASFDECKDIGLLRFDFAVYDSNKNLLCLIEYDGKQHFEPVDFAKKGKKWAEESFREIQRKDTIKNNFCSENNINLIRIPYWEDKNIEKILKRILDSYALSIAS